MYGGKRSRTERARIQAKFQLQVQSQLFLDPSEGQLRRVNYTSEFVTPEG